MTNRHALLAGAALMALAGCATTTDTGRATTPTYARARMVAQAPAQPAPPPYRGQVSTPVNGVLLPDADARKSGYWVIRGYSPEFRTVIPVRYGVSTLIRLDAGKQYNKDFGGRVDAFDLQGGYSGNRATVGITPKERCTKERCVGGDLKIITTGDGLYRFELVPSDQPIEVVDIVSYGGGATPPPVQVDACNGVFPQGDHTPLVTMTPDGKTPAWAPVEVWADSTKLFARFNKPLPTMPALFAGQDGEQRVNYRVLQGARDVCLVTSRRVTEAEFRRGSEVIAVTVDPAAIKNGEAADPATGRWRAAAPVPSSPFPIPTVGGTSVFVLPGQAAQQSPGLAVTLPPEPVPPAPTAAEQAAKPRPASPPTIPGLVRGI